MSDRAREWYFWIAAAVLVALVAHFGSLYLLPRIVMARALERLGPANTVHVGHRPDATVRTIVRPSPDILYATCPFDLSKGPLRFRAPLTHSTYWSVSAFDSATNNFFVKNDRQIAGDEIEIVVVRPGQGFPQLDSALERIFLFAPSDRGLILVRTVIDEESHLPALSSLLHQARCETVASAKKKR
jgi:uncharacterized membrane protein